jgi:hypothetical protein
MHHTTPVHTTNCTTILHAPHYTSTNCTPHYSLHDALHRSILYPHSTMTHAIIDKRRGPSDSHNQHRVHKTHKSKTATHVHSPTQPAASSDNHIVQHRVHKTHKCKTATHVDVYTHQRNTLAPCAASSDHHIVQNTHAEQRHIRTFTHTRQRNRLHLVQQVPTIGRGGPSWGKRVMKFRLEERKGKPENQPMGYAL